MFALVLVVTVPTQLPEVGIHESRASDRQVRQIQPERRPQNGRCKPDEEEDVIVVRRVGGDRVIEVLGPGSRVVIVIQGRRAAAPNGDVRPDVRYCTPPSRTRCCEPPAFCEPRRRIVCP